MASTVVLFLILAIFQTIVLLAQAGDPDITSDFLLPAGTTLGANFFTFNGLRGSLWGAPKEGPFKVTMASMIEFPTLDGQSVSYAALQYAPGGINTPHTHPHSVELLLILQGFLKVGFVDSTNKLFTQMLYAGDLFVFPKGLVHFQANMDNSYPVVALSAFGSANVGTVSLPKNLFASGIGIDVLAKPFKTDGRTIQSLVFANMA